MKKEASSSPSLFFSSSFDQKSLERSHQMDLRRFWNRNRIKDDFQRTNSKAQCQSSAGPLRSKTHTVHVTRPAALPRHGIFHFPRPPAIISQTIVCHCGELNLIAHRFLDDIAPAAHFGININHPSTASHHGCCAGAPQL